MKRIVKPGVTAACLLASAACFAQSDSAQPDHAASDHAIKGPWNFQVLLDDSPIGTHRFSLSRADGDRTVLHSDASFAVKMLGLNVYSYRHDDTERWRGDCLDALDAHTDDNGTPKSVAAEERQGGLRVSGPAGLAVLPGCVMSFAYWNPKMLDQHRLLNAESGKLETVQIRRLADTTIDAGAHNVKARHYEIDGMPQPVELWYAADDGDWLALEATVPGGRKLRYQRQ